MREDIKERIEMIRRGKVPEGYKKTEAGIVPVIWEKQCFKNLFKEKKIMTNELDKYPLYSLTLENGVVEKSDRYNREHLVKKEEDVYKIVEKNNFAYNPMNIRLGAVARNKTNKAVCVSGYYDIFEVINIEDMEYMDDYLVSYPMMKYFNRVCTGSLDEKKRVHFSQFLEFRLPMPSLNEREKIAKILSIVNKKIKLQENLISNKITLRKYMAGILITGKYRVNNFKDEWKKNQVKKFIKELNEKTTENNQYEILSVTKDGIFKQSEHFNKQIASEDNYGYKVIRKNNLVFSTMNLWMGSLDVLQKYDVGIVSPSYKIFEFDQNYMMADFGKYFMKSNYMIWIYGMNSEQGASVVRRNLDLDGLLNTFVNVPEIEEQKAIAKILYQADKEIELLQQHLEKIKLEKKAIMQLLLTGIVRLN